MAPLSLIFAVALAVLPVVLVMVTGMVTVSPGLMNRGSAELRTMGSATVIGDDAAPKLSFLYATAIRRTWPENCGMSNSKLASPLPSAVVTPLHQETSFMRFAGMGLTRFFMSLSSSPPVLLRLGFTSGKSRG